jgi:uncharacterized protein (DUF111 family)
MLQQVQTAGGAIRYKAATLNGTVVSCKPEYDDVERIALATGVPLKAVMQQACASARADCSIVDRN